MAISMPLRIWLASLPPPMASKAILPIHRPADHRHGLAEKRLRGLRRARLDDGAGALVADRHGLVESRRYEGERVGRHLGRDLDAGAAAARFRGAHVGRPDEQA